MKIETYSPTIRRKEMDAVLTAMVEEKIGPGDRNRLLIQTAKEQLHFDYALALRSPAVALYLALKALNVQQGQAVILSALSPRYYLQVLRDLHLTPFFCDVNYDFPCICKESLENVIASKPADLHVAAILLHHTLGFMPDTAAIAEIGLPVIEDVSQSYGAWLKPKENDAESSANAKTDDNKSSNKKELRSPLPAPHSLFYILGLEERDMLTAGGGALLFSMNRKEAALLREFSGIAEEYCLADLNSALAVVQFRDIMRNLAKRHDLAELFLKSSLSTRHKRFIPINDNSYCNYSFSLVLETGLKDVVAYARKKDIILENAFKNTIAGAGPLENCPVSNSLVLRTVLFPLYPRLSSKDVEQICRLITTLP